MPKNKKLIIGIIGAVIILLVLLAVVLLTKPFDNGRLNPFHSVRLSAPEFLSSAEKADLNAQGILDLSPEAKVQALSRDDNGQVMVIKIINNENDIVADPNGLSAVSPRMMPK